MGLGADAGQASDLAGQGRDLILGCVQHHRDDEPREEAVTIRVGGLKGPTSMGLVKLLDDAENQKTANAIDFRMAASANELNPLFLKGELDIMAVPANLGSVLYNKTEGQVKILAVSTLGVLYIVEKGGETVTDIKSLAGKTIYATVYVDKNAKREEQKVDKLIDSHKELARKLDNLVDDGWVNIYYDIYKQYLR